MLWIAFDLIGELDEFKEANFTFGEIFRYYWITLPEHFFVVVPVLFCGVHVDDEIFRIFAGDCVEGEGLVVVYGFLAMMGTFLYFMQLSDILVCSMKVSAYNLVCTHMLTEAGLFLFAVTSATLCRGAALNCLAHEFNHFHGVPDGFMALVKMILGMVPATGYGVIADEMTIFAVVAIFLFISVVLLVNVTIGQFNSAYDAIYMIH